jgi:hypothetical protein
MPKAYWIVRVSALDESRASHNRSDPTTDEMRRPDLSQSVISSSSRAPFLVFASDISIQTFSPKALR